MDQQIQKLYIEATSVCKLSGSMCFRHGWFDEKIGTMSASVIDRLLQSAKQLPSLKQVMFSGKGEPLVNPHIEYDFFIS